MKVVILAGGFGTRISEESGIRPKPMVEIGGKPILWHIMKTYSNYGFNEFVILLGYKGYYIKEYFANYFLHQSDITIDLATNEVETHSNKSEPWKVTLLETGLNTMTGGRIKQAQKVIGNNPFLLTYGDAVSDINIQKLVDFHKTHGKGITMTSVRPDGKFGALDLDDEGKVNTFKEKPKNAENWINAGFFVCEPSVFNYIENDSDCIFERKPLEGLAKDKQLFAYKHHNYWQCMDVINDKNKLNALWDKNEAPWKVW